MARERASAGTGPIQIREGAHHVLGHAESRPARDIDELEERLKKLEDRVKQLEDLAEAQGREP